MSPKVAKYLGFFYKKKQPNLVYSKGHLRLKNCFITEICSWHFRIRSCRQCLQLPHQLSTAFYIIDPTRRYRIIYSWQAIFFFSRLHITLCRGHQRDTLSFILGAFWPSVTHQSYIYSSWWAQKYISSWPVAATTTHYIPPINLMKNVNTAIQTTIFFTMDSIARDTR